MKTFTAVVEAGSFVRAMEVVGLSKPAVSRHVNELEGHLGTRLLQRTTRRLSLTGKARPTTNVARTSCLLSRSRGRGGASALQAQGRLRIGAPQTFGALHLAALWGRFAARNPQVTLDIVLSDRVIDLVEEGYDLAVRIARLSDSSLVSRRLARTRMVLCASPDYLAERGTPQHPHELTRHDVISYTYWSSGDIWSFQGPQGEETVRTHSRIHANNGDTCLAAALAHQGIILQPDFPGVCRPRQWCVGRVDARVPRGGTGHFCRLPHAQAIAVEGATAGRFSGRRITRAALDALIVRSLASAMEAELSDAVTSSRTSCGWPPP